MVRPQIVNLFPEDTIPEVFTQELHNVQVIFKGGAIFRKPFQQTVKHHSVKKKTKQNNDVFLLINLIIPNQNLIL